MNCLVVGGAGYIGSAVSQALERAGHRVVRIGGPFSVNGKAGFAYSEGLYTALQQELASIDVVVYAAGRVVPSTNVSLNEALQLDVQPLGELLDGLARAAVQPVFVLISSAGAVYGPAVGGQPFHEDSPLGPLSIYGMVRAVMEELVGYSRRTRKVRGVTLRLANVYGPGQRVNGPAAFVVRALTAARTARPMDLWGEGEQRKDFIFIDDVVRAVEAAVAWAAKDTDWSTPSTFNICRGANTSLREMLALVREVSGREVPYRVIPARASDVQQVDLSALRAQEVLGFRATISPRQGLQVCWAAMQEGPSTPLGGSGGGS